MNLDTLSQIREGGILYILLLIAITMHEFGHAYLADKFGDRLPRLQGRVSLNPLVHIDTMGSVVLPILTIALSMGAGLPLVFGWGKPVELMLDNPKTRMKVDLLSTAGGVAMNLVVAFISALLAALFYTLSMPELQRVAVQSVYLNSVLFVLNMLPIPPLDGSRFLKYAIKMSDYTYYSIARYGILILLVIINVPFTSKLFTFLVGFVANIFLAIASILATLIN